MNSIPALEEEIKAACRAWVASGKRLVRGSAIAECQGCALDALAATRYLRGDWRVLHNYPDTSAVVGDIMLGFDYSAQDRDSVWRQLGARIAAWAEGEGLLK